MGPPKRGLPLVGLLVVERLLVLVTLGPAPSRASWLRVLRRDVNGGLISCAMSSAFRSSLTIAAVLFASSAIVAPL